jgi:hypothetical protein
MLFTDTRNPVVELGLRIASFTYGGLLGVFFLGLLFPRAGSTDAFVGFVAGIAGMSFVIVATRIDYTWHTLIGCTITILAAEVSRRMRRG